MNKATNRKWEQAAIKLGRLEAEAKASPLDKALQAKVKGAAQKLDALRFELEAA